MSGFRRDLSSPARKQSYPLSVFSILPSSLLVGSSYLLSCVQPRPFSSASTQQNPHFYFPFVSHILSSRLLFLPSHLTIASGPCYLHSQPPIASSAPAFLSSAFTTHPCLLKRFRTSTDLSRSRIFPKVTLIELEDIHIESETEAGRFETVSIG